MPYKYIGRTTDFKGKTLWEILGNLKNYGVGRIVTRSRFERYPEPSYFKILKVETLASPVQPSVEDVRRVKVLTERTFRGKTFSDVCEIHKISYKTDYRLIPKDEEAAYCQKDKKIEKKQKILPKTMDFPPLLREFIIKEMSAQGEKVDGEPRLEVAYSIGLNTAFRVAKEGETADFEVTSGLGVPASPSLYKDVKL